MCLAHPWQLLTFASIENRQPWQALLCVTGEKAAEGVRCNFYIKEMKQRSLKKIVMLE